MTGEKNIMRSEAEYRKVPMLSSSDLRDFAEDRLGFYKEKVLGKKKVEKYNKAMLIGSIVHCLLLEPENFDKRFFMSICQHPPTANLLLFTEALYNHTVANMDENGVVTVDFQELVDLAYPESEYKITKEAVLKKFTEPNQKTGETAEQYYNQLREAKTKGLEVACVDDINIAEKIVGQVRNDEFVGHIFEDGEDIQSFNEQQIEGFKIDELEMKAMLDKIIANHKEKMLYIIDLKSVYDVTNFKEKYWLKKKAYIQGYVYYKALMSGVLDLGFDYSEYEIVPPVFVVAHSGCFYAPLRYRMDTLDLVDAYEGFTHEGRNYIGVKEIIEDILWSQETGKWNISRKAYENRGVINF